MLVTCPKCGFSQPQDRYCANCGVDMEQFKPRPPPLYKRIVFNPVLHVVLVFILIFLVILFLRKHKQEEFAHRLEFLKGGPTIVSRTPPRPANAGPNLPLPPAPAAATPVIAAPKPVEAARVDEKTTADAPDSFKVHVYYAEVDHMTMEMLRQESQATGQYTEFGDFKAGALPATRKPTRERGVRVLDRVEKKFDPRHLSAQWLNGQRNADAELGLTTLLSLDPPDNSTLRGEVEVLRSFRESLDPADGPVRRSYPSTSFELSPGMDWMITINLPNLPQDDSDRPSGDGIMRIFQSPQYKSRQTEFTLFFEFDTPSVTNNGGKNSQ